MGQSNDERALSAKPAVRWRRYIPGTIAVVAAAAILVMLSCSVRSSCGISTLPVACRWLLCALVSIILVLAASSALRALREPKADSTTLEGGVEALKLIQEWSTWMAGIQTAAFGAFAWLLFDKDTAAVKQITDFQLLTAVFGFVHLGSALFCTAWLLSALPSQVIRLYRVQETATRAKAFDVYEQPLFGWCKKIKLAYMMTVTHWLWAIGLISLAAYCVSLLVQKPEPVPSGAQAPCPAIECKVLVNR